MNALDLCLEVVWGHVNHCVTFAIEYIGNRYREAWFQRTTNRKWPVGYQMFT